MIPVHIIGLGMSPDDLTQQALNLIETAEVLAGGHRHLDYFASHQGEKDCRGRGFDRGFKGDSGGGGKQ